MAGPSVNVVLRLDSSKVKEDAEKAKGLLSTAINPTVDVFNVATKAAELFGKALEVAGKGLVFMTERTGAMQALVETLGDTRKAIGEAADRSGALRTATEAIEQAARSVSSFMRSDEGRQAINGFFAAISSGAAAALDALNGLMKAGGSIAKMFLGDAPKGTRAAAIVEGLSGPGPQGETPLQALLTQVADMLRSGGDTSRAGSGVRDRGTFRDDEAAKAAEERRKRAEADLRWEQEGMKAQQQAMEDTLKGLDEFYKAERDAAMRSLDSKRAIAELTRQVEEGKTATALSNAERRAELEEKNLMAQKARDEKAAQVAQSNASTLTNLANMATQGVANAIVAGASVIANGGDLGAAIATAMGGAVAALGATLIATGTGVLAGAALASIVPGLAALFPPWSTGAALGAIAAGTLLVGGGGFLQSLANGGSATPGAPGARAPTPAGNRSGFRGTPEGFQAPMVGSTTTILNYNFNGPMGGSPRRIAREIRDLNTAGDTLLPGYRSPGGR